NIYSNMPSAIATITETAERAAAAAGVEVRNLHCGMGIAGLITSVSAEDIAAATFPFASTVADNDAYAACIGAFAGGNGGSVIAGAGSIGFAFVKGQGHMVGGWGFALGDHGSGAWLGHHAVRRAALAIDGLLQPTPLIESVLSTAGHDRLHLTQWSQN